MLVLDTALILVVVGYKFSISYFPKSLISFSSIRFLFNVKNVRKDVKNDNFFNFRNFTKKKISTLYNNLNLNHIHIPVLDFRKGQNLILNPHISVHVCIYISIWDDNTNACF